MLDFHHLHRNEETWGPNALKFNPENFTPQKIAERHPYTYLPFSGGPRNCVGKDCCDFELFYIVLPLFGFCSRHEIRLDISENSISEYAATIQVNN